jgi:hypothetical protein
VPRGQRTGAAMEGQRAAGGATLGGSRPVRAGAAAPYEGRRAARGHRADGSEVKVEHDMRPWRQVARPSDPSSSSGWARARHASPQAVRTSATSEVRCAGGRGCVGGELGCRAGDHAGKGRSYGDVP